MKMVWGLGITLFTGFFFVLWLGANSRSGIHLRTTQRASSISNAFNPSKVTQISWHPRAFLYKNFLSDEECDHLISLADGKLEQSLVVDNDNGTSVPSKVRTSSGYFLLQEDEVAKGIARRIAAWSFLPEENGEAFHILRYKHGEKYEPHFDAFPEKLTRGLGGQRYATVLMYLSNVEKGGETVFPNSELRSSQAKDETWSDCAKAGYAVKPKKGDALLFFSLHMNNTTDRRSLHGSCPVIEGEKWSATKWIHVRNFKEFATRPVIKECLDENINCPQWAARGECEKNPHYMVGSEDWRGYCRLSCNVCKP